jgi:hypothetical protein
MEFSSHNNISHPIVVVNAHEINTDLQHENQ